MDKPLEGVRVLDFGVVAVGPFAATLLGYLGADVIRIERPGGDYLQVQYPLVNGMGFAYIPCDCNKRNIMLDLAKEEDREIALKLVKTADVLITNTRLGVMERFGLDYEALSKLNPQLIYCSSPAYGHIGPLAKLGTGDPYMQAFSGFASLNGDPEGSGEIFRLMGFLDLTASLTICQSVLLALVAREYTGIGQQVETSLLESSLAFQTTRLAEYFATGINPKPMGSACSRIAPSQSFHTLDNKYINVSVPREEVWPRLCEALGIEHLTNDPRFKTNSERIKNRDELIGLLEKIFNDKPARWWLILLQRHKVPCGPINTFDEISTDPHLLETGMVVDLDTPWGMFKLAGIPWEFSKCQLSIAPPPRPDGNRDEILSELRRGIRPTFGRKETARRWTSPPLSGIKVMDLTEEVAGPYCSMQLADAGADVIKIEPLPDGDHSRSMGVSIGGESALFLSLNRNKKSICLDLKRGKEVVYRLAKEADVFLVQPEIASKLNLTYESLKQINPSIIYCSISMLGESGPYKDRAASELEVQGLIGYQWFLGKLGKPPVRVGADVCATLAGMQAFAGIVAALLYREKTGRGQEVRTSLLRAAACLDYFLASHSNPDDWLGSLTGPTDDPEVGYKTKDVPIMWGLAIAGVEKAKRGWPQLCRKLGLEALLNDPIWAEQGWRMIGMGRDAQKNKSVFEAVFQEKTADELVRLIDEVAGVAAPYNSYEMVLKHPQVIALEMVKEIEHPTAGRMKVIRPPWTLSQTPVAIGTPAPLLGQHTDEVLSSVGYSSNQIAEFKGGKGNQKSRKVPC